MLGAGFSNSFLGLGLGFRVWGLGFKVWGLGFRASAARLLLQGCQVSVAMRAALDLIRQCDGLALVCSAQQCDMGVSENRGP